MLRGIIFAPFPHFRPGFDSDKKTVKIDKTENRADLEPAVENVFKVRELSKEIGCVDMSIMSEDDKRLQKELYERYAGMLRHF